MSRFKDRDWNLPDPDQFGRYPWESIRVSLLMDLRDELKKLNAVLACPNFRAIPEILRGIRRNTTKPKRRRTKRAAAKLRAVS